VNRHTGIWDRLGIVPTDDVAAIRSAYAERLRATDADSDAAAFAALRHARDAALALAAAPPMEKAPGAHDDALDLGDAEWDVDTDEVGPRPEWRAADAAEAREEEERAARFQELERLLFTEEGDEAEAPDRIAALTEAILADPILERLDAAAGIEAWLARAAAAAIPRSDAMLAPLVAAFGWDRRWDEWDQPGEIVAISHRLAAIELLQALAEPAHPQHKAWLDLRSGKDKLGLFEKWSLRAPVRALLARIRSEAPAAEQALDPYRVGLWDDYLSRRIGPGLIVWLLWIAFAIVRCASPILDDIGGRSVPVSVPFVGTTAYSQPEPDLRPAIDAAVPGMTLERIDAANPTLGARLRRDWSEAKDAAEDRDTLLRREQAYLTERIHAGLRSGPAALQARYWALEADKLRWLRARSPVTCGDFVLNGPHPAFPDEMYGRENRILEEAVFADVDDPPPSAPVVRYTLPGRVVERALDRSGLELAVFRATLTGGGTAPQRCAARIAVLETLLADPKANTRTIRAMSAGL